MALFILDPCFHWVKSTKQEWLPGAARCLSSSLPIRKWTLNTNIHVSSVPLIDHLRYVILLAALSWILLLLEFSVYTVDSWTIQGLGALTPRTVENQQLIVDSPQNFTGSLLSTKSLPNNINSWLTHFCILYVLCTVFLQ